MITESQKQVSKSYFTLPELYASVTADNLHINNKPTPEIEKNLKRLIDVLNPLREAGGSPIRVSSGYRCPQLNAIVGGVNTSAHLTGNAVDLVPINNKQDEFEQFVIEFFKYRLFDQIIREKSSSARWLHLGLYNNSGYQRNQIKVLNV